MPHGDCNHDNHNIHSDYHHHHDNHDIRSYSHVNLRAIQRFGVSDTGEQVLCVSLLRGSSALRYLQRDRYQRRVRGV